MEPHQVMVMDDSHGGIICELRQPIKINPVLGCKQSLKSAALPTPRSRGFDALTIRIDQLNKSNESSVRLTVLYCRDSNSWKKNHLMWVSIDPGSWSIVISEADGGDAEGGWAGSSDLCSGQWQCWEAICGADSWA